MATGSLHKENATDQQCDHCGRWFGARGIHNHERNCDGETDTGSDDHVFDPAPDEPTDPTETTTQTMTDDDELTCPECGGTDAIVTSEEAVRMYREADELTGTRLDTLLSYEYYHNDAECMAVFDDE